MGKIINSIIIFCVFLGCDNSRERKRFQEYVDYSGMMISDLNTVSLSDSQIVLDLGAVCIDSSRIRYEYGGDNSPSYFKHPCYHGTEIYRNYLKIIPSQIMNISVDSLLLNLNEIEDVPDWILKKKIKYLDLSSNKIKKISIPKDCLVESINLRDNMIKELPSDFFECPNLKTVYLDKATKKYPVNSDTILVYGKTLVFGNGLDFIERMEDMLYMLTLGKENYPKAVRLEKW